jgi:hypothetical protein
MPSNPTAKVQDGFAASSRALRVPGPLVKYSSPSSQSAPIPAAWGRPSGRDVPRKYEVPGCAGLATSRSRALLHGNGGDP